MPQLFVVTEKLYATTPLTTDHGDLQKLQKIIIIIIEHKGLSSGIVIEAHTLLLEHQLHKIGRVTRAAAAAKGKREGRKELYDFYDLTPFVALVGSIPSWVTPYLAWVGLPEIKTLFL